jgi:hypothetical protein
MAVTRDDLKGWLGSGWMVRVTPVARADWRKAEFSAQWLCQRARIGWHYLYEEASATVPDVVEVYLGRRL